MWVTGVFHQVSLFSLKPSDVTSTGGRSLLIPTPYSIKMAFLDVALRNYGVDNGSMLFSLLRDMKIAISPPRYIIVNNCFVRIHKLRRQKGGQGEVKTSLEDEQSEVEERADEEGKGPYIRSVAFREYIQYSGPLGLAMQVESMNTAERLFPLFPQVNYLGKRGGFFQIEGPAVVYSNLPIQQGYLLLDAEELTFKSLSSEYTLQVLDDCSPKTSFDQVNIFSSASLAVGKDRVQLPVLLPYRITRSSRGFTLYQRIEPS